MNFIDELLAESERAETERRIEMNKLRADQLLQTINVLDGQLRDAEQLADEEIKLIEEYRQSERQRLEKKIRWFAWNLEQFMRSSD